MPKLIELFPDSMVFGIAPLESYGIYAREAESVHHWLQPKANLNLRIPPAYPHPSWLRLTMSGPTWAGGAWLVLRMDGIFSGIAQVRAFGDYYFPIPETLGNATEESAVSLDIEVQNDCSGGPDPRNLAVCLYDAGIVDDAGSSVHSEATVIRDQLAMIQGNPGFREVLEHLRTRETPPLALEMGGGLGVLSALVASITSGTTWCVDMMDYRALECASMHSRLHDMLQRNNGMIVRSLGLAPDALVGVETRVVYHTCSAEDLPHKNSLFDLIFSLNAFEHIRDPRQALAEIRRVLKPGGRAFLQFSPIYFADVGSHLWDQGLLDIPWAPLLHTREEIRALVAQQGHPIHRVDEILDSLNGHPPAYYREIFATCGLKIEYMEEITGCTIPGATDREEFELAAKLFPRDDLLVQGFKVLLIKV